MTGMKDAIGQVAAQVTPRGAIKGTARRARAIADAVRGSLLMTLMPSADHAEILAALFGDLAAVRGRRRSPCRPVPCSLPGAKRPARNRWPCCRTWCWPPWPPSRLIYMALAVGSWTDQMVPASSSLALERVSHGPELGPRLGQFRRRI